MLYEKGVLEGVSLLETMQSMSSEVEKVIADLQPLLVKSVRFKLAVQACLMRRVVLDIGGEKGCS